MFSKISRCQCGSGGAIHQSLMHLVTGLQRGVEAQPAAKHGLNKYFNIQFFVYCQSCHHFN